MIAGIGSGTPLRPEVPLFSGHILLQGLPTGPSDSHLPRAVNIKAILSINPTRFVRHQIFSRGIPIGPDGRTDRTRSLFLTSPVRLFSREPRPSHPNDVALDASADNYLLANSQQYALVSRDHHASTLNRYWAGVLLMLDDLVRSGQRELSQQIEFTPQFKINSGEVYWERFHPSALLVSQRSRDALEARFSNVGIRQYFFRSTHHSDTTPGQTELATEAGQALRNVNSPCYRIDLPGGQLLRIYAKTSSRIRIEVKQDLSRNPASFGPKTSANLSCLSDWYTQLVRRGLRLANAALPLLREHTLPSESCFTLELLDALALCANQQAPFSELLAMLLSSSRIVQQRQDPRRAAIQRLVHQGVLIRTTNQRENVFSAADQYVGALAALRGVVLPGVVPVRERDTRE